VTPALRETIRRNFALASGVEPAAMKSGHWRRLMGRKKGFVHDDALWPRFRANVVSEGLDNANVPDAAALRVRRRCERIHAEIAGRIPEPFRGYLEEVPIGQPRTFEIAGRRVSQSSLEYTYMLARLAPFLGGARIIVEIGAGFGGLARLLKLAFPELRLVLLDLPEASAIQTYFLNEAFPQSRFLYAEDAVDLLALPESGFDFAILPGSAGRMLAPSSVDVFVNTRSMMEMDLGVIEDYFAVVQRATREGGRFYCVNRLAKVSRLADYPFDDRWFAALFEPWPTFIDESPHQEILAVRTAYPVISGVRDQLQALPDPSRRGRGFVARLLGSWVQGSAGRG
jgi:hypothetical protein